MKRNRLVTLGCLLLFLMILMCGCEKEPDHKTTGESWAYIHDAVTEILWLGENGKATYKGEDYTYVKDDQYITLTDKDQKELKMHYSMNKDQMLLYEIVDYHFVPEEGMDQPDGLVGVWKGGPEDRMSYQFTSEGAFLEDEHFPGYFSTDEEKGVIKLMYVDHFTDTYLYYHLNGTTLTIEYPWPMERTVFSEEKEGSANKPAGTEGSH